MNLPAWAQSAGLLVALERVHDVRVVCASQEHGGEAVVIAALASWGIALFEYLVQVPANRIGYTTLSLGQLKVMQEVITLAVFVPFAFFYMKQPLKLDFLWAGLCLVAAAYFMFRGMTSAALAARAQRVDSSLRRIPRADEARLAGTRRAPRDRSRTRATAPRCARRRAA